jgi:hypothetical protein
MEAEEYRQKKLELLNTLAPEIVKFHKLGKKQQVTAVRYGTGSDYLADKWQFDPNPDIASRYLNSDSQNQILWLKMFGCENPTSTDCFIVHRALLFFNNNSLEKWLVWPGWQKPTGLGAFKGDWLKRSKINAFGNGNNWCKLWVKLSEENKRHVIKFF